MKKVTTIASRSDLNLSLNPTLSWCMSLLWLIKSIVSLPFEVFTQENTSCFFELFICYGTWIGPIALAVKQKENILLNRVAVIPFKKLDAKILTYFNLSTIGRPSGLFFKQISYLKGLGREGEHKEKADRI